MSRRGSNGLLGLLDVHAPAIHAIEMGGLAYMSRRIHGELVLRSAGCEHAGRHVCRDAGATGCSACSMCTHRRSRRGGMRGLHACRDAGDYVCPNSLHSVLDVHAPAIHAIEMGGLADMPRRMF